MFLFIYLVKEEMYFGVYLYSEKIVLILIELNIFYFLSVSL